MCQWYFLWGTRWHSRYNNKYKYCYYLLYSTVDCRFTLKWCRLRRRNRDACRQYNMRHTRSRVAREAAHNNDQSRDDNNIIIIIISS